MAKKKRRRTHTKKWDRCVRQVKRRGRKVDPYAICTRSVARRNPRPMVALYAQARGTPVLKYVGGIKFARRGAPVRFNTAAQASALAKNLKLLFPVLRKFKTWAA